VINLNRASRIKYCRYIVEKQDKQQDKLDGLQDEHIGCRTSLKVVRQPG